MNSRFLYYIEVASRIYVFLLLTIYGAGKLMGGQFYRKDNLPDEIASVPLSDVGAFDLAWTFMGYSYAYILFIGVSQLLGAVLLLFERTKLLGVLILIPILVNIVAFDAIFLDTYGALGSASIYLSLLCLVLFLNKAKIVRVVKILMTKDDSLKIMNIKTVLYVGILVVLYFGIDQFLVNILGH